MYKAELIRRRMPWQTREAVEPALLERVWWSDRRLLESIGYVPPAEAAANCWRRRASQVMPA